MSSEDHVNLLSAPDGIDSSIDSSASQSIHLMDISLLFAKLNTSEAGLTSEVVKKKKALGKDNAIPPPIQFPSWMCCVAPCLINTVEMELFKKIVPTEGLIKRANRDWVNLDAIGIQVGDILKVTARQRVAADIRIFEVKNDCKLDPHLVTGDSHYFADSTVPSKDIMITDSTNMALAGYLCLSGECTGVVVNTGPDTLLARFIKKKLWPVNVSLNEDVDAGISDEGD